MPSPFTEADRDNLLESLHIAAPCSVDWNTMTGDEKVRFCGQCKLNVYNLSEMTRKEATDLVIEKEGKMCVQLYKRQDGTVITQNCPVGLRKLRDRVYKIASAIAGLMWFIFTMGGAFAKDDEVNGLKLDAPPPNWMWQLPRRYGEITTSGGGNITFDSTSVISSEPVIPLDLPAPLPVKSVFDQSFLPSLSSAAVPLGDADKAKIECPSPIENEASILGSIAKYLNVIKLKR